MTSNTVEDEMMKDMEMNHTATSGRINVRFFLLYTYSLALDDTSILLILVLLDDMMPLSIVSFYMDGGVLQYSVWKSNTVHSFVIITHY